jgi:hypothetical protein
MGNWNSVSKRFSRWCEHEVRKSFHAGRSQYPDIQPVLIDSTIIRAHACAAGAAGSTAKDDVKQRRILTTFFSACFTSLRAKIITKNKAINIFHDQIRCCLLVNIQSRITLFRVFQCIKNSLKLIIFSSNRFLSSTKILIVQVDLFHSSLTEGLSFRNWPIHEQ